MERAVAALTWTGQITDERRQEFVLWSDALGLSMLVDALGHTDAASGALPATESTVLGPFYVAGAPGRSYGESIAEEGDAGEPVWVLGRVLRSPARPLRHPGRWQVRLRRGAPGSVSDPS